MNLSTFHNQLKHNPQKGHRHGKKRLTEDQVSILESCFESNKKLDQGRKHELSRQLGIPPRQIAIWYQNRRARWKNQSLELDYTALQLQLEATLAETRHLHKEVERLRTELSKVQADQQAHYNNNYSSYPAHVASNSLSSCVDEVGSTPRGLQEIHVNNSCGWDVNGAQAFQVEELYACVMGTDHHGLFGSKRSLS